MSTSRQSRRRSPVAAWLGMLALLAVLATVVPLVLDSEPADLPAPTRVTSDETPGAPSALPEKLLAPVSPALPAFDEQAIAPLATAHADGPAAVAGAGPRNLAGRVVRASDGTPLAGATVAVAPSDLGPSVSTDAGGLYALALPPDARRLEVSLPRIDRSWPHAPASYAIPADTPGELQLVYDSGFILSGTVSDDQGEALPHAKVCVLVSGSGLWSSRWTTADAKGRYTVPDLSPPLEVGAIAITAEADGHCPAAASLPLSDSEPGVRTVDLRLSREGAIEITALDERRQPVEIRMALVRTESDRIIDGQSQKAGVARVGRLPAGRHTVAIVGEPATQDGPGVRHKAAADVFRQSNPEPMASAQIEGVVVEPGRITPVEIVLQPGASVSGVVTDHSGLPLNEARVWFELVEPEGAKASDDTPARRYARAAARLRLRNGGDRLIPITVTDGRFALKGLPAGPVRIVAEASGCARASTVVNLAPGERREHVDLALRPGVELRGRVQLADGSPMQFCTSVFVLPADPASDEVLAVGETRFEGSFTAVGLEPGPKRVLVVGADGSWAERVVDPADEPQTFVAGR